MSEKNFIDETWIEEIETPCIVADMKTVRRNIEAMQKQADACGCALRPHIKTHKNIEIAKLQTAVGAKGITCAKVSEAEVMAEGGLNDIFVAYPLIGENRIRRAVKLSRKLPRLILAADSLPGATALSKAAHEAGIELEIRLEADTGLKRTGAAISNIAKLAREINMLPSLRLTGIFTFKSLVLKGMPTTDAVAAGVEEGQLMSEIFHELKSIGIPITDISAGSTPTAISVAKTGLVNEIRPGTYVFYDYMTLKEGACESLDDIATHIYATVVSTPMPDYAIIDGGTKTFPTDAPINTPPYFYPGYAIIEGREDLVLGRMNEEHGIITNKIPGEPTGLHVGQILKLIPIHVCPAINLQNQIYLLENGVTRISRVDARGMLV